jgi:prolyl oligopeptidase
MNRVIIWSVSLEYPPAREADVIDQYHGRAVADPYQWMEDLASPELAAWIAAQNEVTLEYLRSLPLRDPLRRRITELWNYKKAALPLVESGRLFYQMNAGLQKQAPVYLRRGIDDVPQLVLDPNALSEDGSTALMAFSPSPDARLLAYTLSESGADWQTVCVRDVASGRDLGDRVRWMRFSALSWTKDARGFFYSRFPEPPAGQVYEAALSGHALYYHRLGTPQAEDVLVYDRPDLPAWFVSGTVTDDGRYLLITLSEGATNSNRLYAVDLLDPHAPQVSAPVRAVFDRDGAEFLPIGARGSRLYVRTDEGAPNRAVLAVDLAAPAAGARTVVPERSSVLGAAALADERLVTEYLADVQSRVFVVDADDGRTVAEVPLPGAGVVAGLAGRADDPVAWLMFTSPLLPATVFAFDLRSGALTPFEAAMPVLDLARYETTRMQALSRDGTAVTFFMTSPVGRPPGPAPLALYGYGGFSVNVLPAYRPDVPAWLERGGVWVTANIRGGAEYGEAWHRAGMRERKQNVFDDFIAVAEHLVREGVTSPAQLAIMGGSNGGLLVAAVMEQRPDLFAAALPAVGVLDMLRYDRFTGGQAWITEYGSSADEAAFATLLAYSPLHNLRPGTCYPATLVTTADRDDRVVPSHSFKFVAALQRAQGCRRPVLIRVEMQASHGYRPTDRRIAELADQWAFVAANTGLSDGGPDSGTRPDG